MAKRRILYVNHTAALGGGEIALANLIGHLDRDKIEPFLLLFADGALREKVQMLLPVSVIRLPTRILTAHKDTLGFGVLTRVLDVAACVLFTVKVAKMIRRLRVDIVHTNSLKADVLGGVAARLVGVPVVWHVRDRISYDYLPRPVVKAFCLLARVIPARVIANSRSTLSTLVTSSSRSKRMRRLKARCGVVHDGVAQRPLAPSANAARECVVVGIVGRISPWKGQDVFLKAAVKVRERYPKTVFRVIGAPLFGEEEYESSLQILCDSLGMRPYLEFTGFRRDVDAAIEDLDVLVHASVLEEPFGQVIIEGMAAGKPVIATNGGGVPEIVIDQITGLLVPMNDVDAMAAAMMRLCASPTERQAMGIRGKHRVIEHFGIQKVARKVEWVYDTIRSVESAPLAPEGGRASWSLRLRDSSITVSVGVRYRRLLRCQVVSIDVVLRL